MSDMCNPDVVHAMIAQIGNDPFRVIFVKKNGKEREMKAKRGVTEDLKGGTSTIKDHGNLIGCHETGQGYKCFDAARVLELHGAGMVLKVLGR